MLEDSDSSDSSEYESPRKYKQPGFAVWNKQTIDIIPRPNASHGYWLCTLLPLALSTRYLHNATEPECTSNYKILTVVALGMCVESLCFFAHMYVDRWLFLKLLIALVPSILTSALFKYILSMTWGYGLLYGFAVTFYYQHVYMRVMRGLPKCFSYGEAAILIQGLMLFALNAILKLKYILFDNLVLTNDFDRLNVIMMSALFYLIIACVLLALVKTLRKPLCFYPLMVLLLIAIILLPVTNPIPIITLFEFLFAEASRLLFVLYFLVLTFFTVVAICWQLRKSNQKANTRVRKIFHLLIVLVYVPGLIYQCAFLYIASGVALAIFTILELFRILNMPPLGEPLKNAFASFSDEKDAGALALTPFSLLIGCSLPIWLHTCPCDSNGTTKIALLSGILSTGIGDAAASIIGSKFGRIKWRNSFRSLEGSVAFVISVWIISFAFSVLNYVPMSVTQWLITLTATMITALIEAHTDQIDNLVLPLVFYIIVNLV